MAPSDVCCGLKSTITTSGKGSGNRPLVYQHLIYHKMPLLDAGLEGVSGKMQGDITQHLCYYQIGVRNLQEMQLYAQARPYTEYSPTIHPS